jgi:Dyp-type peroxidase family
MGRGIREFLLQDGIYFRKGDPPPGRCYRLMLLNVARGATLREAGDAISMVWAMLSRLRDGFVLEFGPEPPEADRETAQKAKLTCLLGFGARLFRNHPELPPPPGVVPLDEVRFPSLPWAPQQDQSTGEADLALQLIANSELAVNRAIVETWMLIDENRLPLEIVTFFGGFNREDRRGWLGFHDGISNVTRDDRRRVLEVSVEDPRWMLGGTYMGFLRLAIDLKAWRRLPLEHQELLVGRDKTTGCPLESVDCGPPKRQPGCPFRSRSRDRDKYVTAPTPPVATPLRQSHIHRTNPNRQGTQDGDNRIFRQGYEFVEMAGSRNLRVGLNFVSFQRDVARLRGILTQSGWLGDANFGGVATGHNDAFSFVSMLGEGFYAVPPRKGERFPGASLF